MRDTRLPARLSRSVLMIGMPPATAASKASATPASSARRARRSPCFAISALLAVTTCLPRASAVSTTSSATPSAPPISSTTAPISGSAAIAAASSYQRTADRSTPRSRRRSRAETATTTIRRPARNPTGSACRSRSWTVAAPTAANPATGVFRGGCIFSRLSLQQELASRQELNPDPRRGERAGGRFGLGLNYLLGDAGLGQHLGDSPRAFERVVITAERIGAGFRHRRIGNNADG